MSLPEPVEALWARLQQVRADILREVEGLSQTQSDWKPAPDEWSVGEIVHHLTVAEIATGKVTTKLTREAEASGTLRPFPADLRAFTPVPMGPSNVPMQAPPVVWPEHGKPIAELVAGITAVRARSRESIEKLGRVDPRPLTFKHFRFGDLDLAQWWILQAEHDGIHLGQIRDVKSRPGFPRA